MKHFLIILCFLNLSATLLQAQSVQDLNKAVKRSSASRPASAGSSGGGSNDAFAAYMLVRSIFWMGQGIIQLGREEVRLAAKNREERMNHIYCLDLRPQAGYGLTGFARLQPQVRANIGWFSLDLKQTILQDAGSEFRSLGFLFWLNILNREKFRLRCGAGTLQMNKGEEVNLQYALGAEYLPTPKVRFELELGQSQARGEVRPFREIQFRVYYPFWTKGFLQASVFGGASNQQYYGNLDFTTLDAGLNFRLSASRFR